MNININEFLYIIVLQYGVKPQTSNYEDFLKKLSPLNYQPTQTA